MKQLLFAAFLALLSTGPGLSLFAQTNSPDTEPKNQPQQQACPCTQKQAEPAQAASESAQPEPSLAPLPDPISTPSAAGMAKGPDPECGEDENGDPIPECDPDDENTPCPEECTDSEGNVTARFCNKSDSPCPDATSPCKQCDFDQDGEKEKCRQHDTTGDGQKDSCCPNFAITRDGTTSAGDFEIALCKNVSLAVVVTKPQGAGFEEGWPKWRITSVPEGSSVSQAVATGIEFSFNPDVEGEYSVECKCIDASDSITIDAVAPMVQITAVDSGNTPEISPNMCINAQGEYKKCKYKAVIAPESSKASVSTTGGVTSSASEVSNGEVFEIVGNTVGAYSVLLTHGDCPEIQSQASEGVVFEFVGILNMPEIPKVRTKREGGNTQDPHDSQENTFGAEEGPVGFSPTWRTLGAYEEKKVDNTHIVYGIGDGPNDVTAKGVLRAHTDHNESKFEGKEFTSQYSASGAYEIATNPQGAYEGKVQTQLQVSFSSSTDYRLYSPVSFSLSVSLGFSFLGIGAQLDLASIDESGEAAVRTVIAVEVDGVAVGADSKYEVIDTGFKWNRSGSFSNSIEGEETQSFTKQLNGGSMSIPIVFEAAAQAVRMTTDAVKNCSAQNETAVGEISVDHKFIKITN